MIQYYPWSPALAELKLSRDDVHVWQASLDQPTERLQQLAKTLSNDEQERAKRFYFEQDRQRFIAGRGILRTILGRYLSLEPKELQFCYSHRGKPALALATPNADRRVQFNLSHSQGLVIYAVTDDRRVGIDIEHIRPFPDAEQLAQRFFCAREYAVIRELPASQKLVAFFNGWTRKEAYLKAVGDGLAGLEQVEVSLGIGEPPRLLSIAGESLPVDQWSLLDVTPAEDYVATLAVEGYGWHLGCWQWSD